VPAATLVARGICVSYPATDSAHLLDAEARRGNAVSMLFFLLITVAFLLRFSISPQIMDRFVAYNSTTGPIYEKLHFGTYAILVLAPLLLFSRPIYLRGDEIVRFRALLRFTGLIVLLVVYLVVIGGGGNTGMYVDTYLCAGVAGLLMFAVNADLRRAIGGVVVMMLVVSALMGIFEAVTEIRILPYDAIEDTFRPIGLTEHPLTLGMMCASGIGFAMLTPWRIWARLGAAFVLFIGVAASGARFSLLLAGAEIFALLILVPWPQLTPRHERQAKIIVLVLTLVGGALLISVMAAAGLLSRFSDTIFDENYMARITVYQVFGLVDLKSILIGTDLDTIIKIVNDQLGLPYIESTPVVLIFQFGLPLAIVFVAVVARIFGRMLHGAPLAAWIATLTFFVAALSNNTLSTKSPVVTIVLVLLIGLVDGGSMPPSVRRRREVEAA
jgi:hypothetical protein